MLCTFSPRFTVTLFRISRVHGTPPWFAIAPVFDVRERLVGFSIAVGENAVAIHKTVG